MIETSKIEELFSTTSETELRNKILFEELAAEINILIRENFERLISMLYRIDVSETRLKEMLQAHPDKNAGDIIASLLIERQLQKIQMRKLFSNPSQPIDEEEKW